MSPKLIVAVFFAYTALLFAITWLTARKATNRAFFIGNKTSPMVRGLLWDDRSFPFGVTFMSVPGWVGETQFSYFLVVAGYLLDMPLLP